MLRVESRLEEHISQCSRCLFTSARTCGEGIVEEIGDAAPHILAVDHHGATSAYDAAASAAQPGAFAFTSLPDEAEP